MSRYYANELLNNRKNDIQHWKYVKKIPVGKGYRYFYSWAEYKAYLADPAADLKKAGNTAKFEIKKAGTKSYSEVKKRGKKAVEKVSSKKSSPDVTIGVVKAKNKTRDTNFKKRVNDLAKRASKKWNENKEAAKKSIEKGKEKLDKLLHPIREYKEKKAREAAEAKRKEEAAKKKFRKEIFKKYGYIQRIKVNGKYRYFYSKEELDAYNRRDEYMAKEPKFMKNVKHSADPYTSAEDAILVNPKYDSLDERYQYNCAECTAIYELRRRGYDVESNGESGKGDNWEKYNTDKRYELFYKNAEIERIKPVKNDKEAIDEWNKQFAKYPPGSRGDISFAWKDGGGHSIVWEKDSKGKVHFIDTQVSGHGNKVEYDMSELVSAVDNTSSYRRKSFKASDKTFFNQFDKVSQTRIVRTDNVELKPEIKNICEDSGDKKRKPNNKSAYKLGYGWLGWYSDTYKMSEKELVTNYPTLMTDKQIEQMRKRSKE